ncbi:MAG TPA: hypothetical protein VED65_00640 [Candidatus Bathyarchaeia archaeon]|nr:hypothetical protein [Candidatus Bathyarchaeia archaeon]
MALRRVNGAPAGPAAKQTHPKNWRWSSVSGCFLVGIIEGQGSHLGHCVGVGGET